MSKKERDKKKVRYASAKDAAKKDSGFELTTIALPKGIGTFGFKNEGKYEIDVLPYRVGVGNPRADEGTVFYERRYYVHKGVGPENKWFCCLAKTFHEKCPICEHADKLNRQGADADTIKAFRPAERQLFAVIDTKNRETGIQILEGPFYNGLGEQIRDALDAAEDDDATCGFFHLEDGLTLRVSVATESAGERTFKKPKRIDFLPRKKQYEDDFLDEVPCLDDLPTKISYDKLKEIFETGSSSDEEDEDDEEETTSSRKRDKEDEADDEDEDEEDEDEEEPENDEATAKELGLSKGDTVTYKKKECDIIKISPDGTSLTLEDEDGKTYTAVAPDEVKKQDAEESEDDDEEEDEKPKRSGKKPSSKDDDEDEDEEDEEEESDDEEPFDDDEEEDEEEDEKPKRGKR